MAQRRRLSNCLLLALSCLCGLASLCQGVRPSHDEIQGVALEGGVKKVPGVCLDLWDGRFGNQVIMLQQGLEAARAINARVLRLPHEDGSMIRKVLRLEDNVWSLGTGLLAKHEDVEVECAAVCGEWESCTFANGTRMDLTPAGRTAEPKMLRHLLSDQGRLRCDELGDYAKGDRSTLTMHMRSGDVLMQAYNEFGYHRFAPCQFWVQALNNGNYSSALIVTEPDQQHPCIGVVQAALPGKVTVQSKSELEDFCTIMSSHSLAVSFSTLGTMLVELSPTLRTLYAPTWCTSMVFDRSSLLEKCVEMTFAGYPERFESWPQKRDYLLSFPADGVSMEEKPCGGR